MLETRLRWLRRAQLFLLAAFAGAVLGLWLFALHSPSVLLIPSGDGPWIWAPVPPQTGSRWIAPDRPAPESRFERRFTVVEPGGPVTLRLRALRDVHVVLNERDVPLTGRDPRRWKEAVETDLAPFLVAGENRLELRVRNPEGVALLQVRIDGLGEPIAGASGWLAAVEPEPLTPAAAVDDTRRLAAAATMPSPAAGLGAHAVALALLAAAGAALFLALRGRPGTTAPRIALAVVALFWLWLLVVKIVALPPDVGFDAPGHLAYLEQIANERRLPLPSEGLLAYHPPLYHATTALLLSLVPTAPGGGMRRALLSLLPVLSGIGLAVVAAATARLVAPGRPWLAAGAALATGFLPMCLTLAPGVSNELPHAFLASVAVWIALRALLAPEPSRRDDAWLGLALGAALLTKYTSAMLVPILVGGVAAGRWLDGRMPLRAVALGALRSLALVAALAGWLYARNLLLYGDPFVSLLGAFPGRTLWQYPGFHTPSWFASFGDALTHPWYAGFHSFWDALYTTLWGDGMLTGAGGPDVARTIWHADWMAAGFALALPATAVLVAGWARVVRCALRGGDARRRVALTILAALPLAFLLSLLSVNLRYPFWSFPKSFYGLFLAPALALFGVLGFEALDRALASGPLRALRPLPWAWAAAFVGTTAIAFAA